jgi:hypothetical protein
MRHAVKGKGTPGVCTDRVGSFAIHHDPVLV